jgi:hypothetical protein
MIIIYALLWLPIKYFLFFIINELDRAKEEYFAKNIRNDSSEDVSNFK